MKSRGGPPLWLMDSRGGPPFGWWILEADPPFLGCMLMNSRGGPPILRGGPPLGTISMDQTVYVCIKITKSCFCLKKIIFKSKFQKKKSFKHPKVRPFLEYLPQSPPKVQENKVFWIYLNFSKMESAVVSVDVSLRSEKRITVQ